MVKKVNAKRKNVDVIRGKRILFKNNICSYYFFSYEYILGHI